VLAGEPYGEAPYGIAVPKGNGMAKAVQDALKALIADGTYGKILQTWGTTNGAITDPVVNGATS
jgi:polar amino acid transport system substrate-binding protein